MASPDDDDEEELDDDDLDDDDDDLDDDLDDDDEEDDEEDEDNADDNDEQPAGAQPDAIASALAAANAAAAAAIAAAGPRITTTAHPAAQPASTRPGSGGQDAVTAARAAAAAAAAAQQRLLLAGTSLQARPAVQTAGPSYAMSSGLQTSFRAAQPVGRPPATTPLQQQTQQQYVPRTPLTGTPGRPPLAGRVTPVLGTQSAMQTPGAMLSTPTQITPAPRPQAKPPVQIPNMPPPPLPSLGPHLLVAPSFADVHGQRMVLALRSGVKSEVAWALNALTVLSYADEGELKAQGLLAKIPGLLDTLLLLIDEWRDAAWPRDQRAARKRLKVLGYGRSVTGYGMDGDTFMQEEPLEDSVANRDAAGWWWEEDGLFNLDELARAEKHAHAVCASNILRNLSFSGADKENAMSGHVRCLALTVAAVEDMDTHDDDDEELVKNMVDVLVNVAGALDLNSIHHIELNESSHSHHTHAHTQQHPRHHPTHTHHPPLTVKRALNAALKLLDTPRHGVSTTHFAIAGADIVARLAANAVNESLVVGFGPKVFPRLVQMLASSDAEVQASATVAMHVLMEADPESRPLLAQQRGAIRRLLSVAKTHPTFEVSRKAVQTIGGLAASPYSREHVALHEPALVDMAMTDGRLADAAARVLFDLSPKGAARAPVLRAWGS